MEKVLEVISCCRVVKTILEEANVCAWMLPAARERGCERGARRGQRARAPGR